MRRNYKKILLLTITAFGLIHAKAQNCTVNSGVNRTICINQTMTLNGNKNGVFNTASVWTQIAGPSVIIKNPSNPITTVTGFAVGQTYTFRLSATCRDGIRVFDDVRMSVVGITVANAGADILACPGSSALNGNAIANASSAIWSVESPSPNTPNILTPTAQNTTVNGMIAGIYKFRYTVYSQMGICPAKFDEVLDTLIFKANAGRDTGFCDTGVFILRGTSGSTGTWTKLSGGNATIVANGSNTAILSNAGSAGSPYSFL